MTLTAKKPRSGMWKAPDDGMEGLFRDGDVVVISSITSDRYHLSVSTSQTALTDEDIARVLEDFDAAGARHHSGDAASVMHFLLWPEDA